MESWPDAVDRLVEHGEDARVIAGGQSLVPMMMLRMAEPTMLIDPSGIGRGTIERVNGHVVLPALTRHVDVETSDVVRSTCPVLADAARCVGNIRVRHRGTIGGSLAHAEPTAEMPCVAVALGARVRALGPGGQRVVPVSDLVVSHFQTSLAPGEVITAVEVPVPPARCGAGFAELTRRPGDFASVEVAAVVELDDGGSCRDVRIVVGATADRPLDASDAAASLRGARPDPALLDDVARAVSEEVQIGSSAHGSVAYRRTMVRVFVARALRMALTRARERGGPGGEG